MTPESVTEAAELEYDTDTCNITDLAALQVKEGQEVSVVASIAGIQDKLAALQETLKQLFPPPAA